MQHHRHAILFIHGFPLDSRLWDPQVDGLRDVAEVLVPDLRGFGSDMRNPTDAMSMQAYAADLLELVEERGLEQVILCGLSMGGYIALAFLEAYPEKVRGLILANTRASGDTAEGRASREETARNAFDKGMAVIARGMISKVLGESTRLRNPNLSARVEAMMARQRPEAVAAASRGMALRQDRSPMLPSIAVPTLIITSDQDQLMPMATSQAMADAIPGSSMVVLLDAGHLSNVEAPEDFNTAVRSWLVDSFPV